MGTNSSVPVVGTAPWRTRWPPASGRALTPDPQASPAEPMTRGRRGPRFTADNDNALIRGRHHGSRVASPVASPWRQNKENMGTLYGVGVGVGVGGAYPPSRLASGIPSAMASRMISAMTSPMTSPITLTPPRSPVALRRRQKRRAPQPPPRPFPPPTPGSFGEPLTPLPYKKRPAPPPPPPPARVHRPLGVVAPPLGVVRPSLRVGAPSAGVVAPPVGVVAPPPDYDRADEYEAESADRVDAVMESATSEEEAAPGIPPPPPLPPLVMPPRSLSALFIPPPPPAEVAVRSAGVAVRSAEVGRQLGAQLTDELLRVYEARQQRRLEGSLRMRQARSRSRVYPAVVTPRPPTPTPDHVVPVVVNPPPGAGLSPVSETTATPPAPSGDEMRAEREFHSVLFKHHQKPMRSRLRGITSTFVLRQVAAKIPSPDADAAAAATPPTSPDWGSFRSVGADADRAAAPLSSPTGVYSPLPYGPAGAQASPLVHSTPISPAITVQSVRSEPLSSVDSGHDSPAGSGSATASMLGDDSDNR